MNNSAVYDESLAEEASEVLPIDVPWLLRTSSRELSDNATPLSILHPLDQQQELVLAGAIEEPIVAYPLLEAFDFEHYRSQLLALTEKARVLQDSTVCNLYIESIREGMLKLDLLAAVSKGDSSGAEHLSIALYGQPSAERFSVALGHVYVSACACLEQPSLSPQVHHAAATLLRDPLMQAANVDEAPTRDRDPQMREPLSSASIRLLPPQAVKAIFDRGLELYGLSSGPRQWQVHLSRQVNGANTVIRERTIYLPEGAKPRTVDKALDLFAHEIEGHVLRAESGWRSRLRLLGIGFAGNLITEEALATVRTPMPVLPPLDDGRIALLVIGLALGLREKQRRSFRQVFDFVCAFRGIDAVLRGEPDDDVTWNRVGIATYHSCMRVFRGSQKGDAPLWCLTKDIVYAAGRRRLARTLIELPEEERESYLHLLRVGRTTDLPHHLAALRSLGITRSALMPAAHVRSELERFAAQLA